MTVEPIPPAAPSKCKQAPAFEGLEELQDFFDTASIGLHWVGRDGTILRANAADYEPLGYAAAEYIGRNIADFHADAHVLADILARLTAGERLINYPARLVCKDGSIKQVLIDSSVLFRDGEFVHTRCFTRDDTRRHEAEAAATRVEQRLLSLAEAMTSVIWTTDAAGLVGERQHAWQRYTGQQWDDYKGAGWMEAVHPADRSELALRWAEAVRDSAPFFAVGRVYHAASASYRHCEMRGVPVNDGAQTLEWVGTTTDVEERHAAESRVRVKEERYRMAEQAARMGTWEWDMGDSVIWSESLERLYGLEPGTYAGTFEAFAARVHPDDIDMVLRFIGEAAESGSDLDFQHRAITADGSVRWMYSRGQLLKDAAGKPVRMVGVGIDVTEVKRAEEALELERKRLAETAAHLQEALAAKDEFLGMISHELRTPITTIFGNADVLQRRSGRLDDDVRDAAISDIRHEAERLQRIIDNMLVLSRLERGQRIETEPLLVHRLIERMTRRHRWRFESRAVHFTDVRVPPVLASQEYVEQILGNLLSNAEKYSPHDAPIDIDASITGGHVLVTVSDRGPGIAEDERERVFSPFYRSPATAQFAQGAGIGLAVCRRLAEAQGGDLWVRPREGGGSTFGFTLPLAPDDDAAPLD